MLDLKSCVWITGASSGIGGDLALKMASEGLNVAISARSTKKLIQVRKKATNLKGSINIFPVDIISKKSVKNTVKKIEQKCGRIGTAILNAGINEPISSKNFSSEKLENLMQVNYVGTVNCLDVLIKKFINRKSGHISVVSSLAGYLGFPESSGYCPTKAALINLCESLKNDLDQENVVIQLINPGFVKTPMTDKNDFFMPFLISVDKSTQYIWDGIQTNKFEIFYPKFFGYFLKFLRILPYFILFPILKNLLKIK